MENIKETIVDLWKQVQRPGIDKLIEFLNTSDFFTAPCSTQYHLAYPGGLAEHSLNVFRTLSDKCDYFSSLTSIDFPIVPLETIIICALGHDLCKVNYYQEGGEPATGRQLDWAKELLSKTVGYMIDADSSRLYEAKCLVIGDNGVYKVAESLSKEHAGAIIGWLKDGYRKNTAPEFKISYTVKDQFPMGHGEKSVSILQDFIPLNDVEKLAIRWHMCAFDPGIHFNYPSGYPYREAVKLHPLVTLLFTADYEASNIIESEKKT